MSPSSVRFSRMRHVGTAVTAAGMVGGAALAIWGVLRFEEEIGLWMLIAGVVAVLVGAIMLVMMRLALKIESNTSRLYMQLRDLSEQLVRQSAAVEKIAENTLISDAAKSIAHRSDERDALRGAIYEEVRREDFDAAFHLIDELERRLGYREEAESLRGEIHDVCTDVFRRRLKQALQHVHGLMDKHRWSQARAEIERLEKVMPDEQRVKDLWMAMEHKRALYKEELMSAWNQEAERNNIERCLEIVKELDPYLTRQEARLMEASAREVFKERILQLGMQFQFAVKEKRWQDALASGLQIIEEFPNSRMAGEVRDNLEPLRTRAGIATDFEVTSRDVVVPQRSDTRESG